MGRSGTAPRGAAAAIAVGGALVATPAAADVIMPLAWDLGVVALPLVIPALVLEAIVLNGFLGDRFVRALKAAIVVNVISAGAGALLGLLSVELDVGDVPGVAFAFLLTLALEYALLRLLLYRDRRPRRVLRATVLMNVITYILLLVAVHVIRDHQGDERRRQRDEHLLREEAAAVHPAPSPTARPLQMSCPAGVTCGTTRPNASLRAA